MRTPEWFWEGHIQARIREHLERGGWTIVGQADTATRQRGVDLSMAKAQRRLAVELKGYPSAYYQRGPMQGERKRTSQTLQASHDFAEVLLAAILRKADTPEFEIAIGLPDFPRYRNLLAKSRHALERLGFGVYLVAEDGTVTQFTEHGN